MKRFLLPAVVCFMASFDSSAPAAPSRVRESGELGGELDRAMIFEPAQTRPKAVLICLHGIQSNREWWIPLGEELAAHGIAVWTFNRPGSGQPVPEGPARTSRETWDAQMHRVREAAGAEYPGVPAYAVGVSWGASPALVSVKRDPAEWKGAILLNPAFKTARDADFKRAFLGHLWPHRWFSPITLPLQASDYTTLESTERRYLQPEQLKRTATFGFLRRTNSTKKEAIGYLKQPALPVLVLLGTRDPLVTPRLFDEACGGRGKLPRLVSVEELPVTHAAIVEPEHVLVAQRISRWVAGHLD